MSARHVVVVASGKGGVGKSTVSLNLSIAVAEMGRRVGLLDADVYGPDIPLMLNLTRTEPARSFTLVDQRQRRHPPLQPVSRFGVEVMSVGFLLGEQQPVSWSAPLLDPLLRRLVHDVEWGDLDLLVVDLPPGTADVTQTVVDLFPSCAAIVVVTPQDVSHLDAKKLVEMFRQAGVKVLGGVENMSGLMCPHCRQEIALYPPVPEERSIWGPGLPRLASLPYDVAVASGGSGGSPVVVADPGSEAATAIRGLAAAVLEALEA